MRLTLEEYPPFSYVILESCILWNSVAANWRLFFRLSWYARWCCLLCCMSSPLAIWEMASGSWGPWISGLLGVDVIPLLSLSLNLTHLGSEIDIPWIWWWAWISISSSMLWRYRIWCVVGIWSYVTSWQLRFSLCSGAVITEGWCSLFTLYCSSCLDPVLCLMPGL